ncbi:hypothetical protein O181_031870 [Austropuccinia psidii MF-1]|uniref:Uncharacterized protein n=1 Tax=Austropuccinia psidii MF-1 TaxID=1389203 RepID=A0A9Q3D001_9BASI|nr:hypothetical protein [Austropuccinia psidii MF-1]
MVHTLLSSDEDWQPCISPQVASTMEFSLLCLLCVLVGTSEAINCPKSTSNATTTSHSERARRMGRSSVSGLKTQERYYGTWWSGKDSMKTQKEQLGNQLLRSCQGFPHFHPDNPGPNTSRV